MRNHFPPPSCFLTRYPTSLDSLFPMFSTRKSLHLSSSHSIEQAPSIMAPPPSAPPPISQTTPPAALPDVQSAREHLPERRYIELLHLLHERSQNKITQSAFERRLRLIGPFLPNPLQHSLRQIANSFSQQVLLPIPNPQPVSPGSTYHWRPHCAYSDALNDDVLNNTCLVRGELASAAIKPNRDRHARLQMIATKELAVFEDKMVHDTMLSSRNAQLIARLSFFVAEGEKQKSTNKRKRDCTAALLLRDPINIDLIATGPADRTYYASLTSRLEKALADGQAHRNQGQSFIDYTKVTTRSHHAENQRRDDTEETDQSASHSQGSSLNISIEAFTPIELRALSDYFVKQDPVKGRETFTETKSALSSDPAGTSAKLLPLVRAYHKELLETRKNSNELYAQKSSQLCVPAVKSRGHALKSLEYPLLRLEHLLREILHPLSSNISDQNEESFIVRNRAEEDDIAKQLLRDEEGLLMQFETKHAHAQAFKILADAKQTSRARYSISRLRAFVESLFGSEITRQYSHVDVTMTPASDVGSREKGNGDLNRQGNEHVYHVMRLYHMFLVRLYTVELLAEWAAAEAVLRANRRARAIEGRRSHLRCDTVSSEHGSASQKDPPASERARAVRDCLMRREALMRCGQYSATAYERDVVHAIGENGCGMSTLPRIVQLLRNAAELAFPQPGQTERPQQRSEAIINNEEQKTPMERRKEASWCFRFECQYKNEFVDDEWGSVGEIGDVARLRVRVMKKPEEEDNVENGQVAYEGNS